MAGCELYAAASFLYVYDIIEEDMFLLLSDASEEAAPRFQYWRYP